MEDIPSFIKPDVLKYKGTRQELEEASRKALLVMRRKEQREISASRKDPAPFDPLSHLKEASSVRRPDVSVSYKETARDSLGKELFPGDTVMRGRVVAEIKGIASNGIILSIPSHGTKIVPLSESIKFRKV